MWSFVLVKQRTAYEMRISDWRSDVCSSDLAGRYYGTLGRASYATCGRHPGLVPGSNVPQALAPVDSWMPEQVRHDGVRPIKASLRDTPGRIRTGAPFPAYRGAAPSTGIRRRSSRRRLDRKSTRLNSSH